MNEISTGKDVRPSVWDVVYEIIRMQNSSRAATIIEEIGEKSFKAAWRLLGELSKSMDGEDFKEILNLLSLDFYRKMSWIILEAIKKSGMGIYTFEGDPGELMNFLPEPAQKFFEWIILNDSDKFNRIFNLIDELNLQENGRKSDEDAWSEDAYYFVEEGDPLVYDWDYAPWFWHEERADTIPLNMSELLKNWK